MIIDHQAPKYRVVSIHGERRAVSSTFLCPSLAASFLEHLTVDGEACGGWVEEYVPGVGWVEERELDTEYQDFSGHPDQYLDWAMAS